MPATGSLSFWSRARSSAPWGSDRAEATRPAARRDKSLYLRALSLAWAGAHNAARAKRCRSVRAKRGARVKSGGLDDGKNLSGAGGLAEARLPGRRQVPGDVRALHQGPERLL